MRKYVLAAVAAFSSVGTAHAANPSFLFTPNVYTNTASTAAVFENFSASGAVPNSGGAFVQSSSSPYTETANNARVFPGSYSAVGTAVNPDPGGDNYLAIGSLQGPGSFSVGFGTGGVQYFSFSLGSLDNYNGLTLSFSDNTSLALTGLGIITGLAANNTVAGTAPASSNTTGRLNIYMNGGASLTNALFTSSQAAFEIDDLAAAVPEPGTWGMMILGFGLVGGSLRARRRKTTVAFA